MKQITSIKPNVDLVELDGKRIYLVGTAHISDESVALVTESIQTLAPDTVAVELCEPRLHSLKEPNRWQNTDIYQVIKSGQAYVLMAQLALAAFQKKLGKELQVKPGAEMIRAVELAEEHRLGLSLVDRSVKVTLKRAWGRAGFWSMIKTISSLGVMLLMPKKVSKAEIEAIKAADTLNAMIEEFEAFLPGVKEVLIDERDKYMAEKIRQSPGRTIVAVVGAGHVPGMINAFGTEIDLARLDTIPPPSLSSKLFSWSVPALFLIAVLCGFLFSGKEVGLQMITHWAIASGGLAAIGAVFALAHPLTILTAFLSAPFTTLHPLLAAGWFAGLVEALVRKPKVKDLELLSDDILTMKGFWKNGVTRILLVCAFTNLGAALGAVIGFTSIASNL